MLQYPVILNNPCNPINLINQRFRTADNPDEYDNADIVETPDGECKFWLEPVRLARNKGVPQLAVRQIEKLIFEHQTLLTEKYNDFQKYRE